MQCGKAALASCMNHSVQVPFRRCVHFSGGLCRRKAIRLQCRAEQSTGSKRVKRPEWVSILEDDIDKDPDIAELLQGTGGDPDRIREKMRDKLMQGDMIRAREGIDKLPNVIFQELNYFRCWFWLEFYGPVSQQDLELLDALVRSWFVVGKLGGYNSQNMQVSTNGEDDQSYFKYDLAEAEDAMGSYFHDIGPLEMKQSLVRFWVDLGTCDELAVDVLLNTLFGFSREHMGIKRIHVGGDNAAWPAPAYREDDGIPDFSSLSQIYDEDDELDEALDESDRNVERSLGL